MIEPDREKGATKKAKKLLTRLCANCNKSFQGSARAWYCSTACKQEHYRKRKEAEGKKL